MTRLHPVHPKRSASCRTLKSSRVHPHPLNMESIGLRICWPLTSPARPPWRLFPVRVDFACVDQRVGQRPCAGGHCFHGPGKFGNGGFGAFHLLHRFCHALRDIGGRDRRRNESLYRRLCDFHMPQGGSFASRAQLLLAHRFDKLLHFVAIRHRDSLSDCCNLQKATSGDGRQAGRFSPTACRFRSPKRVPPGRLDDGLANRATWRRGFVAFSPAPFSFSYACGPP